MSSFKCRDYNVFVDVIAGVMSCLAKKVVYELAIKKTKILYFAQMPKIRQIYTRITESSLRGEYL